MNGDRRLHAKHAEHRVTADPLGQAALLDQMLEMLDMMPRGHRSEAMRILDLLRRRIIGEDEGERRLRCVISVHGNGLLTRYLVAAVESRVR